MPGNLENYTGPRKSCSRRRGVRGSASSIMQRRHREPAAARGAATVEIRESRLGPILVDESGHSLYSFTQDNARRSVCTSDFLNCPTMWPPLTTTGRPHATGGAKAALLGTIRRTKPAGRQVTYNGHPVYRYIDDRQPSDLKGQGVYSYWYVLSPSGRPITTK
jgi:predicted lipoprotein with Yx(FWY)xxD motif